MSVDCSVLNEIKLCHTFCPQGSGNITEVVRRLLEAEVGKDCYKTVFSGHDMAVALNSGCGVLHKIWTRSTHSKFQHGGGGVHHVPPLPEEVLAVGGC